MSATSIEPAMPDCAQPDPSWSQLLTSVFPQPRAPHGRRGSASAVCGLAPHLNRIAVLLWPAPGYVRFRNIDAAVTAICREAADRSPREAADVAPYSPTS